VSRIICPAFEVIDHMNDQMRGSRLTGELKILSRQHVTIEAQAEFHE
jgi:hypothetical protein